MTTSSLSGTSVHDDWASTTIVPYLHVARDVLKYARDRDYRGWDYADGMSSRFRRALPFENRWVNLLFQETIKRAPVNVRPLFAVEQRRNYKGTALFTLANLQYDSLVSRLDLPDDDIDYRGEVAALADWLVDNRCSGYSGFCGGHRHELQHLHTKGKPNDADMVSTTYAVLALLAAADINDRYRSVARTAEQFVVNELDYREVDGGARINYHLNHDEDVYTINAGAVGARMFLELYDHIGEDRLRERATALLDHIADLQTAVGGWYYRDPPSTSHLSMDNHHNGFIIEAFQRYHAITGRDRYASTLASALSFYQGTLFDPTGAPNFDESTAYPRDIHATAQGLLVFSRAGDYDFADQILTWALENLYADDGRFYYRKHRFYTKRITLMRWCQAWMAYAITTFLLQRLDHAESTEPSR